MHYAHLILKQPYNVDSIIIIITLQLKKPIYTQFHLLVQVRELGSQE
jgi:hypothetical protein